LVGLHVINSYFRFADSHYITVVFSCVHIVRYF